MSMTDQIATSELRANGLPTRYAAMRWQIDPSPASPRTAIRRSSWVDRHGGPTRAVRHASTALSW